MAVVRWLFVVPAAVATWYGVLALGLVGRAGLIALCPQDQIVSGACTAPWFGPAQNLLVAAFAGLAAAAVMVVATAIAPARRVAVARLSLAVGGIVALYMGIAAKAWWPLMAALLAGVITLLVIQAFLAKRTERHM